MAGKGPIWIVVFVVPHGGVKPVESEACRLKLGLCRYRYKDDSLKLFWALVECELQACLT